MDRTIELQYVSTTRNIADLLTKALGPKAHDAHRHAVLRKPNDLSNAK